jgi:hypothetical protein
MCVRASRVRAAHSSQKRVMSESMSLLGPKDAREARATFIRRVVAIIILVLLVLLWVGMVEVRASVLVGATSSSIVCTMQVAGAMQQGCDDVYHKPFAICFAIHASKWPKHCLGGC